MSSVFQTCFLYRPCPILLPPSWFLNKYLIILHLLFRRKKLSRLDLKIGVHQFQYEMQSPHSHCCPLQSQPSFRYHLSLYFSRYYLLWKSSFFNAYDFMNSSLISPKFCFYGKWMLIITYPFLKPNHSDHLPQSGVGEESKTQELNMRIWAYFFFL